MCTIKVDDIVACDVKGRKFHGVVLEANQEGKGKKYSYVVKPIESNVNYFHITARNVERVYRRLSSK